MITYAQLTGVDEDTARRVLVAARSIAPGVDRLEGEPAKDAVAILRAVARELLPTRGSRHISSQGVATARVSYRDVQSAFTKEDRDSLRSLVGLGDSAGHPEGNFPKARPFKHVWPDEEYS
ncbi:hypothetical protein [Pseudoclavibacter sp. RFBB5]|uniref:hypothetical protein n=1 Tax=Pseudoclavibacter sp. RFBB5 TaxID=2080574 RepID=UPI000CE7A5D0|nr:hypothetical protein [Pseudoclavibacter sp. RFBB5]PPG29649.1 hypothetical protein C5B97_11800 [Pseudoclavibacter sp. RFBB5]